MAMLRPVSCANVRRTSLMSASLRLSESGSPVYVFSALLSVRPPAAEPGTESTVPVLPVVCGCGCAAAGSVNTFSPVMAGSMAGGSAVAGCVVGFVVPRRFLEVGGVCVCGALMTDVTGLCCSGIFHAALPAMVGTCDGISVAAATLTGGAGALTMGAAATCGSSFFGAGAGGGATAMTVGAAPKVMLSASPDFAT